MSVAFSPDGTKIVGSSGEFITSFTSTNGIKLWNVQTGQEIISFTGHKKSIWSVAFSPDGTKIVSGSYDKTIKLWDVNTGQEIRTITGHKGIVHSVVFSPDGTKILSGGGAWDKTIKLWEVNTGQEIRTFTGHTGSVNAVAFSPDGTIIASCSNDSTLKLWNTYTGNEIQTISGHNDKVHAVAFSPDGTRLVSAGEDRYMYIWKVPKRCMMPTEISAKNITSTQIPLIWKGAATAYQIRHKAASQTEWNTSTTLDTFWVQDDLQPNASYEFEIRSVCDEEDFSDWMPLSVTTQRENLCPSPTEFSAQNITATQVPLTWNGHATAYQVRHKTESQSEWNTSTTLDTFWVQDDLQPNTAYQVEVRSVCGQGDYSDWIALNVTTEIATGLSKPEQHLIRIQPNPTQGWINIDFEQTLAPVSMRITNSMGQVVYQQANVDTRATKRINLAAYPNGVYYLHLQNASIDRVEKIMVNR